MAMLAPAFANRFAIALPIPRVPPVISTVLLANVMISFLRVATLKTEFIANYDVAAKNRVLLLKPGLGILLDPGVIHEDGKLSVTALVKGGPGGYFCIVSCLKIRQSNSPEEPPPDSNRDPENQCPIPIAIGSKNQSLNFR